MATLTRGHAVLAFCLAVVVASRPTTGVDAQASAEQNTDFCLWYEFRCNDGECVPKGLVCDGEPHCRDESDENEKMCQERQCYPSAPFRCKSSGECIPSYWVCDGTDDCTDGEDEEVELCQPNMSPPVVNLAYQGTGAVRGLRSAAKDNTRTFIRKLNLSQPLKEFVHRGRRTVRETRKFGWEVRSKPHAKRREIATLAMGCFWRPDSLFGTTIGVRTTRVGYTGGTEGFVPTYNEMGDYTEAIQMRFDPDAVSFIDLLHVFWKHHNTHVKYKKQYASYIYYHNSQQKSDGTRFLATKGVYGVNFSTILEPASRFFDAEDYHQKYRLRKYWDLCDYLNLRSGAEMIASHRAARLNGYVVGQGGVEQFDAEAVEIGLDQLTINYVRRMLIQREGRGLHC